MNKNLLIVFVFSLALLVGCGGGGGGSNPAGPTEDPLTDYPTIAASFVAVENLMKDNGGDPTTRVNQFMAEISDSFTNVSGQANKKNDLRAVTLSRLQRYNFNDYVMMPIGHNVIDANTVEVATYMMVNVVKKPGAVGNAIENTPIQLNNVKITWKKEGGVWRILTGLPYTAEEYLGLGD
jgi:hypothetical protein